VAKLLKVIHENKRFKVIKKSQISKDFFYIEKPNAVCTILYDIDYSVLMLVQERITSEKTSIELPGGRIDEDETPVKAAIRELYEETGYCAQKIDHLLTLQSSPSFTNELVYVYSTKIDSILEELKPPNPDNANTKILKIKKHEIHRYIQDGKIAGSVEVAALLFWIGQVNKENNYE